MSHEEHIYIQDSHENEHETPKKSNLFVRVAVIIGMILILLFIAFTIVKYIPKFISSLGQANVSLTSLFNPKEKMSVTVDPSEIQNGGKFTVSWKNTTSDTDGSTVWSYKCVEGITVKYNSINGERPVICNTLFPLPDTGSYAFTVTNSTDGSVTVPMSVSFWNKDLKTMKFSGSANLTVAGGIASTDNTDSMSHYNGETATSTTTKTGVVTKNNPVRTNTNYIKNQTYAGPADLAISLVSVGRLLPNGNFEKTNSFTQSDRVVVTFNVSNVGSGRSGTWFLKALLPTTIANERTYTGIAEPSLNPGDVYQMTLAFDSYDASQTGIQIAINGNDTNQSNNTLTVSTSSTGTNNNNNCYYINGVYTCNNSNSGHPDLLVTITDVGIMDRNTNQFYYSNSFRTGDKVAVKFTIQNIGGTDTGSWSFNANLPSNTNGTYYSGNQTSLRAGQSTTFTLGFENPYNGSNTISIQVDPNNIVNENNESNNFASRSVFVGN